MPATGLSRSQVESIHPIADDVASERLRGLYSDTLSINHDLRHLVRYDSVQVCRMTCTYRQSTFDKSLFRDTWFDMTVDKCVGSYTVIGVLGQWYSRGQTQAERITRSGL